MNQKKKVNSKTINERLSPLTKLIQRMKDRYLLRHFFIVGIVLFLLNLFLLNLGFVTQDRELFRYGVGDIAENDLVVERTISYVDNQATERKRSLALALVRPVYVIDNTITTKVVENYTEFSSSFHRLASEGGDLLAYDDIEKIYSQLDLYWLLADNRYLTLFSIGEDLIQTLLYSGYFDMTSSGSEDIYNSGIIEVVNSGKDESYRTSLRLEDILTKENVDEIIWSNLESKDVNEQERELLLRSINLFFKENGFFSKELTDVNRKKALELVEPVIVTLNAGDVIAHEGTVINPDTIKMISSIKAQEASFSFISIIKPISNLFLLITVVLLLYLMCGSVSLRREQTMLFLYLGAIYFIVVMLLYYLIPIPAGLNRMIFLPAGFIIMLASLLSLNWRAVLEFSFILSVGSLLFTEYELAPLIYTVITSVCTAFFIEGIKKRINLIMAGGWLILISGLTLAFYSLYFSNWDGQLLRSSIILLGYGIVSAIICMALLPLFEHLFNLTTIFRLNELSSLSDPMLQRMYTLAQGTYHHSITVAQLAEPACRNIGSNGLLARVGSYYHDIGKVDQADYFIENQANKNRHDDLKPNLSASVIKSHVRVGVERGRESKLPLEVLDIIQQHHGTSLIKYFYSRAVKEQKEDGKSSIKIEDYMHWGPKPQTKEAGVVMLADAAEAATRTLKKPTKGKLEKFTWELIMDRLQSGELSDCDLTLKELEIIKDSFVHVLLGIFHTRIEYPEQNKGDNNESTG